MRIKCAWCGDYMGLKPPYLDVRVTHSICPPCQEAVLAERPQTDEESEPQHVEHQVAR